MNRLKIWVAAEECTSLFKHAWLNVIIVKRDDERNLSFTLNLLEMQDVQVSLNQKILKSFFSFIKIFYLTDEQKISLTDEQIFSQTRFRRLKELLWRQMNEMRMTRLRHKCLYLIVHLNKFFQIIVSHTTASLLRSFNFVIASRHDNEVVSDYADHLSSFLRLERQCDLSLNIMSVFVASSILLNVYSLKMHRESSHHNYQVAS